MGDDITAMGATFALAKLSAIRAKTPPVLSKTTQEELEENFHWLDADRSGAVHYDDLVHSGLVDKDLMEKLRKTHDKNGDGLLDCSEFVDMLCPLGFRAHGQVVHSTDEEGRPMSLLFAVS